MKHFYLLIFLLSLNLSCEKKTARQSPTDFFSIHLFSEPLHLNPSQLRGSSASYFFQNVLRGLYRFDNEKGLIEEGGKCEWITNLELHCNIVNQIWSNGEPVTSQDYLRNFQILLDPKNGSPRANILSHIKNANSILSGKKLMSELGIVALNEKTLKFVFEKPDFEFLFKLTSTALIPLHKGHLFTKEHSKDFITNGPYQIDSWSFGKEMILKANPYYKKGHPLRPLVKLYFIEDEMTAYRLYKNQQLSFLRRIPSKMIKALKKDKELFFVPMARFDYVGFGKTLMQDKNFRLALAHSVDYEALKKMLHALGRPGCPSLPAGWIDNPPCYTYDLKKAKAYLAQVSPQLRGKTLKLKVSHLGGEDIKQQAEFFQNQWKINLDLSIEINQVEQKVFLSELQNNPPDIFRKGVGLDWPTCLNALETFVVNGEQNYILWKNKEYEDRVAKMYAEKDPIQYRILCRQAVSQLMSEGLIIPLGEMHFSILASPLFKGWSLNSMNQLDLSQLHPAP